VAAAGNGEQFGIGGFNDGRQQAFVDAGGAEYAPTQFGLCVHDFAFFLDYG